MEESNKSLRISWAFPLALSLLGPFLFLSVLFSIFAPLPSLYLHQGSPDRLRSRLLAWASVPVGVLICFLVKGPDAAVGFAALAGLPGVLLGEFLEWRRDPEFAIASSTTVILVLLCALGLTYITSQHTPALPLLRGMTKNFLNKFMLQMKQQGENGLGLSEAEVHNLIENPDLLLFDAPGLILAGLLLLHIIPTLLLVRWNPKAVCRRLGLGRDYLRSYSAPEWLVIPSIACVAFLVFEVPYLTPIASNLLKPLLVVYFFHGMSILAYFLDSFRLRGPLRYILYSAGLVFLTPMVVSFGFFDLWFNFRSRFQSTV